jgi:ABC-type multidrug transport system ATPase subunit
MKKVVMTPNPYRDRNFKFAQQAERILRQSGIETKICLAFDVDRSFELPSDIRLYDLEQELKDGVLHLLGIEEFLHKQVRKLSGGMKKRLSIGCAMAKHPPVLLLDEPTAALDLVCKEHIASYLSTYKAGGGILLLTTHDPAEVAMCDVIYILKDGVLVPFCFDGDVQKLVANL